MTRLWVATAAAAVAAVAVDIALGASRPGFVAVLGYGGCVVLVLGSKAVVARLLKRPETYYSGTENVEVRHDA